MDRRNAAARWILLLALALHIALLYYFTDRAAIVGGEPILRYDYALHFYQVDRATEALARWGSFWSYDPFVLAGQPAGAIEDLTSKSVELWCFGLMALGVPLGVAFNLYIFLVHLAMPFCGYAAARLFGAERATASLSVVLWVLLWYFDSFLHWCWHVGMISWAGASYLSVLLVALAYRAMTSGRTGHYVLAGLVATSMTLIHPFGVLTVLFPLLFSWLKKFKTLSRREHALLFAGAAAAASTALIWVGPAWKFKHYIGEVTAFLRPTVSYVILDYFDLLHDTLMTGQPVRTLLRTVCFVAAAILFWRWYRTRDDRLVPLGTLVGAAVLMAYATAYLWALRQTQPYRHIGPAALAAAIPASMLLRDLFSRATLRSLPREASVLLVLCAVLLAPRLVRTVLQYMPSVLPERRVYERPPDKPFTLPPPGEELPLIVMDQSTAAKAHVGIREFLEQNHGGRGRVVTTDWVLGEYLAAFTDIPVLGGIPQRNVPHADAHLFRHDMTPRGKGDDPLKRYLELYAAGFVVAFGEFGLLDFRRDLLEPAASFEHHRVYRVLGDPSYFLAGAGRIESQALNSIVVADASGPEVVIRFHWMETLACRPGCTLRRVPVPGDRMGFIGVPYPPRRFEIFNVY